MPDLMRLVLHPDGAPNLAVLVPTLIAVLVVGGAIVALIRARFAPPEPVPARDWAHAAYSIWTGGEDCGEWDPSRARDALRDWYSVTEPTAFWRTIAGLRQGQTSSLAWDHVRAIDLLRIGTAAGYVAQHECWREVSSIATTLRERYDSWLSLAQAFESGMHAWQDGRGIQDAQARGRIQRNMPYLRKTAWSETRFDAPLEG